MADRTETVLAVEEVAIETEARLAGYKVIVQQVQIIFPHSKLGHTVLRLLVLASRMCKSGEYVGSYWEPILTMEFYDSEKKDDFLPRVTSYEACALLNSVHMGSTK